MNNDSVRGLWSIVSLQLRQHQEKVWLWVIGLVTMVVGVGAVYDSIYATQEDLMAIALTMQNPAMTALLGPAQEAGDYTVAVAFASEMLIFTAVLVAVMNIMLVSAMTRLDEDEGRLELIQALPVGRLAYPLAAMIIMLVVNGLIAVLSGVGIHFMGDASFGLSGSLLFGSILGAVGMFFAGATLVVAQLSDTNRGARGLAFGVLIMAYILRAIGDVSSEALSQLSPLGWAVRGSLFVDNHWWPVGALLVGSVVLMVVALWLNARRDLFSGLLPGRPGRSQASGFLKTLPGFVWSQEKTMLISWAIGIFLMAAVFGSVLGELEAYFSDMEILQAFLGEIDAGSLTEEFVVLLFGIMALFVAVPGVSLILSLKGMETKERIDHVLSRTVSRKRLMATYFVAALVVVVVLQLLLALGVYSAANQVMAEPLLLADFTEMVLVFVPSLWFMIGLAVLIVGLKPVFSSLIWLYLAFAFVVTYLGGLLEFPEWVNQLSVFYHAPTEVEWPVLLGITGLAVVVSAIGFVGYNRRDIG